MMVGDFVPTCDEIGIIESRVAGIAVQQPSSSSSLSLQFSFAEEFRKCLCLFESQTQLG